MRHMISIICLVFMMMAAIPATARIPVSAPGCDPSIEAAAIEDILALESTEDMSVERIQITCKDVTRIEVFTEDQSLVRRIPPDQIPSNGVERFLALNAAEMLELFARPSPEPEPQSDTEETQVVSDEVVIEPERDFDRLKLHVAGLARFELGAPSPAGGAALEVEFAPTESLRLALDFQTASSSSTVSGEPADQLFLASAIKIGYALSGARFVALFRAGGVQVARDASDSSGWAFWGGPALSAGYRLPIVGPLFLDGSTEVGYSPWTWGAQFDGEDAFRTDGVWATAQLGVTVSF